MWPLGHAAIAYLLYSGWKRLQSSGPPASIAVVVLLVGSSFPDLVDKPLAWYVGVLPTGRTLAHSLFVLIPLCGGLYLLARRYGNPYETYAIAFAVGAISHSLVDAVPALWGEDAASHLLWPLTPVETYEEGAPTVLGLLADSITDPYFLSEFVFAALAFALWRADGYPGLELFRTGLEWGRRHLSR